LNEDEEHMFIKVFRINVRFGEKEIPPSVLPLFTKSSVSSQFSQAVKESLFLRESSSSKYMKVNTENNEKLFEAVTNGDFLMYINIAKCFLFPVFVKKPEYIPLKILFVFIFPLIKLHIQKSITWPKENDCFLFLCLLVNIF
jgi:hypothetical protein